jgi:hypothetical protein
MTATKVMLAGLLVGLTLTGAATAAVPRFTAPDRVAAALERHFNGPGYRQRLNAAGTRLTTRVLCAHEDYGPSIADEIDCTGRMAVKVGGRTVPVRAKWTLVKKSALRAKLSWTFRGSGVFEADYAIIRPRDVGLRGF